MLTIILSTSEDPHPTVVQQQIENMGHKCLRFDFNLSPQINDLSVQFSKYGQVFLNKTPILRDNVSGVFVHHPLPPKQNYQGVDSLDSSLLLAGWRNSIDWLEEAFKNVTWINKPSHSRIATSIFRQLNIASSYGMRVPQTLFTNEYEKVKLFATQHDKLVVKSGPLMGVNLEGYRLLTHIININEITEEELHLSPCIFQEYIEKAFELRIHVINDTIYACRIDSQESSATKIDWRNYRIAETPHTPFTADTDLANKCRKITRELGLVLGIFDIIMTPDGEPVFLECNSQGHWLWIEELTGMPITEAIATALIANG